PLTCTNHRCGRECHLVAPGNKCEECELGCSKPRPPGCPHPCPRPCHSAPCPPCSQTVRQRCHCKISGLYIPCMSVFTADDETKTKLTSCNNQCPKELSCGHRCRLLCHPGDCGAQCVHKVKLRCPCRRIKKVRQTQLQCDDTCKEQQRKVTQVRLTWTHLDSFRLIYTPLDSPGLT
uniref:NF-X1-type domain-containing protein n=1 Tax=Periophthalmus magnuspinnatus TaxID=409849 RepID=A0A3B4A791_9GOBI